MEGIVYSPIYNNSTIDAIEMLQDLETCRNIWVFTENNNIENDSLVKFVKAQETLGDCLREMYTWNDSRDNLYIIGDVENLPLKLSLHKNYSSKKYTGNLLFAGNGNIPYSINKGAIEGYGNSQGNKTGYCLDIAFCNPCILSLFCDNFDCNTFHDLLSTGVIGHNFSCQIDKKITMVKQVFVTTTVICIEDDFMSELKEMVNDGGTVNKLELNGLRLAYGKNFSELINSLVILGRNDLVLMIT